jgi:hypothetical protein
MSMLPPVKEESIRSLKVFIDSHCDLRPHLKSSNPGSIDYWDDVDNWEKLHDDHWWCGAYCPVNGCDAVFSIYARPKEFRVESKWPFELTTVTDEKWLAIAQN